MASRQKEVIGDKYNFWLHSETDGFDLTHAATPTSPSIYPRVPLETTTARVVINPARTALVVVDLQNYFLSPSLGRPRDAAALKAIDQLVRYAIPACRKAGIQIVWLEWGLTQQDIDGLPPAIVQGLAADKNFDGPRRIQGPGSDIGPVELEDGSVVEGGRALMRNQWNTDSYAPLEELQDARDLWIEKTRWSAFGTGLPTAETLYSEFIRTLLFAGADTDQSVGGTLQDAVTKGWDCLLRAMAVQRRVRILESSASSSTPRRDGDLCCRVKTWPEASIVCRLGLTLEIEDVPRERSGPGVDRFRCVLYYPLSVVHSIQGIDGCVSSNVRNRHYDRSPFDTYSFSSMLL